MTNKVSLDKSKIKFVLFEGVHQSALDTLHAAGYTNIDYYKKALDGDELKEAIIDYIKYYNKERIKLNLGGLSPITYRRINRNKYK